MLSKKMQTALNNQIVAELYSAYLYLSMSAYFQSLSLGGLANWMRVQFQEEVSHAMKMFDFVNQRGGRVLVGAIEKPPTNWASPRAAFEATYKHEQKVTGLINKLVDLAIKERDHATESFLQWFVSEQVEEEASADEVVKKLKLVDKNGSGLLMVDQEMGQRVFTPPAPGEGG
jgi:ferritin